MEHIHSELPFLLVQRLVVAKEEEMVCRILGDFWKLEEEDREVARWLLWRVALPPSTRQMVKRCLYHAKGWKHAGSSGVGDLLLLEFLLGGALVDASPELRDAVYYFLNPRNADSINRLRSTTIRFRGDRAAAAYYVISESMRDLAGQRRFDTLAALSTLLYDRKLYDGRGATSRFGEQGSVHEAGKLWHKENGGGVAIPPVGLATLPYQWELQLELGCDSLAGADVSQGVRKKLLDLKEVCLLDLYIFLRGWGADHDTLTKLRLTERQFSEINVAYADFFDSLCSCRRNDRISSSKIAWIIPDDNINQPLPTLLKSCELESIASADMENWLPWVSLSAVNCLRRWRAPLINGVRRALLKIARDLDPDNATRYPWERRYRRVTSFIPIEALYQYENSNSTLTAIGTLRRLGFRCLNDLRFLHPEAVSAAKRKDDPLLRLHHRLTT